MAQRLGKPTTDSLMNNVVTPELAIAVTEQAAESGADVVSFNGRTGAVLPVAGDYSPADVSLGNVTNDSQLKRAAGDFSTFANKASPVGADVLLIEDSADAGAKKNILISALPGGGGTVLEFPLLGVNTLNSGAAPDVYNINHAQGAFPKDVQLLFLLASGEYIRVDDAFYASPNYYNWTAAPLVTGIANDANNYHIAVGFLGAWGLPSPSTDVIVRLTF